MNIATEFTSDLHLANRICHSLHNRSLQECEIAALIKYIHDTNLVSRFPSEGVRQRAKRMYEVYKTGVTLLEVGEQFNLTGSWVGRIFKLCGYKVRERGKGGGI